MSLIWGIDLGGTKVECVVVDSGNPGEGLVRRRIATEAQHGYEHILNQIDRLIAEVEAEHGLRRPERIGIGTPGSIDSTTQILNQSNTQCLNNRPFQADLEAVIGIRASVANDANCMALAEAKLGAARGYPTVFGIILGTGVGGGFVIEGRILPGRHGIAGEWGQIVLDPAGPVSKYGTRGTVEAFIAGPGLEGYYRENSGVSLPLKEIASRAEKGDDPAAVSTLERLAARFAEAVSIVINIVDPHAIVIGGGVGNIGVLYAEETRRLIESHVFVKDFRTPLLRPTLGDSAGVFGAAMLVSPTA